MTERGIDVRLADSRFRTTTDGLDSRHSFSFGRHYDGANTSYGLLVVNNDDVVRSGAGFAMHPHRDMEIVTWVLQGTLTHRDSTGHRGVVVPGRVQVMSAGRGITHSETNDPGDGPPQPVRVVQMWIAPDEPGLDPGYQQGDVTQALAAGGLVPVAAGRPRSAGAAPVRIAQRDAVLHAARLPPGRSLQLPEAPYLHLFAARGGVDLEGAGALAEGDTARIGGGGQRLTATTPAELLVWEMHARLG